MKIIYFKPSQTQANVQSFNMAHRCVIPIAQVMAGLKPRGKHRFFLRGGEAKELRWHLQNPEFVRFLREHLGVIVIPEKRNREELLDGFSIKKVA